LFKAIGNHSLGICNHINSFRQLIILVNTQEQVADRINDFYRVGLAAKLIENL